MPSSASRRHSVTLTIQLVELGKGWWSRPCCGRGSWPDEPLNGTGWVDVALKGSLADLEQATDTRHTRSLVN